MTKDALYKTKDETKSVDLQARPSSAGRVPGFGAVSWSEYYGRSKGKKPESAEVLSLREQVARFPQMIQEAANTAVQAERAKAAAEVNEKVAEQLNTILPAYLDQYHAWKKSGKRGPCPVPSVKSAGSDNRQEALVTPAAPEGAPGISLSGLLIRGPPAGTVQRGSHSATCAPEDGVVSTLAVLNRVKVTN
jgi:hypothetical protein